MNHNTLLDKLPSSIYTKESTSNNAKLWNLYSSQANAIEDAMLPIYDLNNLSGINLDKFSLILGIEREGRSDADYRDYLLNYQDTQIDTASLPALYTAIAKVCPSFTITELCYPREFEEDVLDGNGGFWDGKGNLTPGLRPKIVEFWNADGVLDGLEPLEPCFIRKASILIEVTTGSNIDLVLASARSVLLPGVAIYIKEI